MSEAIQFPLPFAEFPDVIGETAAQLVAMGVRFEDWSDNYLPNVSGCKVLGSGVSRIAFDLGDGRVLKVAKKECEYINRDEVRAWETCPAEIKEHLCPILAHDENNRWVIMPKVEKVGKIDNHYLWVNQHDLDRYIDDIHYMNVGELDGRCVVIDYGFNRL